MLRVVASEDARQRKMKDLGDEDGSWRNAWGCPWPGRDLAAGEVAEAKAATADQDKDHDGNDRAPHLSPLGHPYQRVRCPFAPAHSKVGDGCPSCLSRLLTRSGPELGAVLKPIRRRVEDDRMSNERSPRLVCSRTTGTR